MDRRGLLVVAVLLVAALAVVLLLREPERADVLLDPEASGDAADAALPRLATGFAGRGRALQEAPPTGVPAATPYPWATPTASGTGRITGRVVDLEERPVAGLGLTVQDGGDTFASRHVVTDGEGRFAVEHLAGPRIQIRGLGVTSLEAEVGRTDLVLVQTYHLIETRVEIARTDGRIPSTGSLGLSLMRQGGAWDFTTVPIKAGAALLQLPSDAHRVVVVPQAASDADGDLGLLGRAIQLDLEGSRPIRLEVPEGAILAGRVLTEDGAAGARVPLSAKAIVTQGDGLPNVSPSTVSHVDGTFRFTGLAEGMYEIGVVGEHLAGFSMETVTVAAGSLDATLVVRGARVMEGWVVDDRGRPLVGATIKATGRGGAGRVRGPRSAVSRPPDGAFRLEGLPPSGPFDVWVEAFRDGDDAWLASPAQAVEDSGAPLTISLARGAMLTGRLEPAEGARALSARLEVFTVVAEGRPRLAGMASPRPDGTFALGPLEAGEYELHARLNAYGGQPLVQRVRVPASDVVVEWDAENAVWGRVEGAGSGVSIALRGDTGTSTTTGAGGTFFLARPPGRIVQLLAIDASTGRHALLRELPGEGKDLVITLVPGARLAGTVADVANRTGLHGPRILARQGTLLVEGRLDPEALTWRFDGLPPGRWSVELVVYIGRRWVRFAADDLTAGRTDVVLPVTDDPSSR